MCVPVFEFPLVLTIAGALERVQIFILAEELNFEFLEIVRQMLHFCQS